MEELEQLYKKTRNKHLKTLRRILRNPEEAEDVFHEAVCRSVIYFPTYNPNKSKMENWFSRIVFNELNRHIKKRNKENHSFNNIDIDTVSNESCVSYDKLDSFIDEVSNQHVKKIAKLLYVKGYTTDQICSSTGFSERFVRLVKEFFKDEFKELV